MKSLSANSLRLLIVVLPLLILKFTAVPTEAATQANNETVPQCAYFFYTEGCHFCDVASTYLSFHLQLYS